MDNWFLLIWLISLVAIYFIGLFIWKKRNRFGEKDREYLRFNWDIACAEAKNNPIKSILDADKLLDYALNKKGKKGSLGEKLKNEGEYIFSDINGVWNAHKLRNKIAHEISSVSEKEVSRALNSYKRALNDLGAQL